MSGTLAAGATETALAVGDSSIPRLLVISYLANAPFSPRGIRTREILASLRRDWCVELLAGPVSSTNSAAPSAPPSPIRKTLKLAHSSLMLDKFEPWSMRRFLSWRPHAAGALLIGFPFSPLVYASRRLAARGIPYVVDVGDPWVLTADRSLVRGLGRVRGRRAERRLWAGAAGAVVSTDSQALALRAIFPQLQILVRPNGFSAVQGSTSHESFLHQSWRQSDSVLRVVHFGDLSSVRLSVEPLLASLAQSENWKEIEFHQFGSDWTGALRAQHHARVVFHEPRPWAEIIGIASDYDLAVVIGNRDPKQLPSKAVAYLQLPIPRLAVVGNEPADALAQYVADKSGWIVLPLDAMDAADKIGRHVSKTWSTADLAPPGTESWEHVCEEIAQFVHRVLKPHVSAPAALEQ